MRAVEIDDAFVDLIDCPKVVAAMEHVLVGRPDGTEFTDIARKDSDSGDTDVWQGNRGVVRCLGGGPRTYPSDPDGEGYTYPLRQTFLLILSPFRFTDLFGEQVRHVRRVRTQRPGGVLG